MKLERKILCALSGLVFTLVSRPLIAQNYLHTEGSRIVDSQGNIVRITGLNWFGLETANYSPHGLWQHSMAFYLDIVKNQGYNSIRLPYCSQLFDPGSTPTGIDFNQNPDLVGLTGLQIMDKVIDGCKTRGLKVILDRHRPDSGGQSALWYTDAYSEDRWISDWKMLSLRYKDNDTVIGCDLHNEPHTPSTWGDASQNDWQAASERCGNAILSVNPNLLIFVEGIEKHGSLSYWWGGELAGAADHPVVLNVPNQLVYSAHDYPSSLFPQTWFSDPSYPSNLPSVWDTHWGYLAKSNTAPILLGEFGTRLQTTSDQQWFNTLADYIKANGLSFTFWCLNPNSGDTGGLLADDWTTVIQAKQQVLAPLQAPFIGSGTIKPPVPTNVTAVAGDASVTLTWNTSSGAMSYNLYRSTTSGGEGTIPSASNITGTTYTNTSLTNGTTYYYKVAAVNAAGISAQSGEVKATPIAQGSGPVAVTASQASGSGPYWGELDLKLNSTAALTAMKLDITLQKTAGLSYNGQYNTSGSQITQTHHESASALIYSFALAAGQTINAGSCLFAAQHGGTGTTHPTSGDTYILSYTSGGKSYTLSGRF